jgi:hypothetical protein
MNPETPHPDSHFLINFFYSKWDKQASGMAEFRYRQTTTAI